MLPYLLCIFLGKYKFWKLIKKREAAIPRCEVGAATVVVGCRINKLQLVSLGLVVLGLFSLVIG